MTQGNSPSPFLKLFFGEGNAIKWEEYENSKPNDSIRTALEPWVKRFGNNESPFLLPRVDPSSKQTSWYVLCKDAREARSMRESLLAFVGPTYSRFNGELAPLDISDPIDSLCHKSYGSFVFQLPIVHSEDRVKVQELLGTLIDYRQRETDRSLATVKPIGRLLRDLEMAILAKNEESAWATYAEIRSRGRLSAINLTFLQVRIYGAFKRWAELVHLPNLSDLLLVRRPKRVSDQIAQAVYQHHLAKYESVGDAEGAIDSYRSTAQRYHNLARSTEALHSPDAVKYALISAIGSTPARHVLAEQISGHKAIAYDEEWVNALLTKLPPTAATDVVPSPNAADVRYDSNDFDTALNLYLDQPHSFRTVCRVLETAVEVDTPKAAEDSLAYLSAAPDEIRGHVLGRRVCTNHVEFLSRILGLDSHGEAKQINSLNEWFEFIDESEAIENAGEILEYGIKSWITDKSFDPRTIAQQLQKTRTGKQAETVRNSIPIFIRALLFNTIPSRDFKPIYSTLIDLLVYDETVGSDDLVAVENLIETILTVAPSHESVANDFTFAVEITVFLWEAKASPRHFDWVLSMLDLLIDTGAQQHTNLAPLLVSIAENSRSWARRINDDQWILLELLARDLGLVELVSKLPPEPDTSNEEDKPIIRGVLAGKSIAVYSLTERIAHRFGQLAEQTFDGIKLQYLHDKILTDRMKSLAQSADIFIVNTWDAKHAATNGIKNNRPENTVTLEPEGKSASSLLRCLTQYLSLITSR
ncbi:MAG: hypothetical protein CME32_16330 [Gimesia sp.]|nr:hypothetical protein [Gimesia sp.]